jgi:agmatine/peptidylarginine deiminase
MAEWEELQGVIITWTSFQSILRQIVDYAQEEVMVYIICSDSNSVKSYLQAGGVPLNNIKYLITSFNSIWVRDYGPWNAYTNDFDTLNIIDWIYNRPRPLDDVTPVFFASYIGAPIYQTTSSPYDLIHTGGNLMVDGHGTAFSSKLILNENPTKTEAQIDEIMHKFLGTDRYIKMNTLPYDVIHHIDMHIKLLDEETLLVGQYPPGVADGPQIETNLQYVLNNFQTCFGRPYKVVRIPMPPEGGQYPPSGDYRTYTNSMIINKTVIIPTYELQYDTTAFRIYREAMPGYNIVGINCNSIIPSLGAIHCIMKEVGISEPVWISHAKMDSVIYDEDAIEVSAVIKTKSGLAHASIYWTTDTSQGFTSSQMQFVFGDSAVGYIPAQSNGTVIYYYISATSNSGRTITKPLVAPDGFYKFIVSPNTFQLAVNVTDGWNMVSVPGINTDGMGIDNWWLARDPGANVFKYTGLYQSVTTATPGVGYWMKHTGARTYNTGDEWPAGGIQIITHAPLAGESGWNMIGGYELSVATTGVTTNPPGLQQGSIFKYSGGYQVATTLDPGYGYWIKLSAAGQIIIPETLAKGTEPVEYLPEDWGKIVLTDATGINYTLYAVKGEVNLDNYELPPAPPAGMFDIRFSSGRIAEDINSSVKTIDMSGVTYPLTVRVEGMDMRLMDETGKTVNVNLKSGENVVISDATIQKLMVSGELIPAEYALEQNYPNPFNPTTKIKYTIPSVIANEVKQSQLITLKVYDVLGNEIATLVNEEKPAGSYEVKFNAKGFPSGVYFYRLNAGLFTETRKMMLLK